MKEETGNWLAAIIFLILIISIFGLAIWQVEVSNQKTNDACIELGEGLTFYDKDWMGNGEWECKYIKNGEVIVKNLK